VARKAAQLTAVSLGRIAEHAKRVCSSMAMWR
jgi:hypothetical protein